MTDDATAPSTVGAIIAGGLARRLGGGDKTLQIVGGQSVLARSINRLTPQVACAILNANGDAARFGAFGLPVIADDLPDRPGPLAGVLAALDWMADCGTETGWLVTIPGDLPFLPRDLVARLHAARQSTGATIACAATQRRVHPIIALWPIGIRDELRRALTEQGIRSVERFMQRYPCSVADWPADPVDPFFNVNSPDDLVEANRLAVLHPGL